MATVNIPWGRPRLATETSLSTTTDALLTNGTPSGAFTMDFVVDSTDPNFAATTLMMKVIGTYSIEGRKLKVTLTPYLYDGNDAYTDASTPAVAAASEQLAALVINGPDLDSFYSTAGIARS